jgi:hypothetical protein
MTLQPRIHIGVFETRPFAELLQGGEKCWRVADYDLKLFAQVAKFQPTSGLKPEIRNALRSPHSFREAYRRQYRNVVIGLFYQRCRKTKPGQKRRRGGAKLAVNIGERNQELATG